VSTLAAEKQAARAAAFAAREAAHRDGPGAARQAAGHATELVGQLRDVAVVSAYLPIRTEIDPRPLMLALFGLGYQVCVPVIEGRGMPLRFRAWTPGTELITGPYGVPIPAAGDWLEPQVLVVPLVAFDDRAFRLGYGGGFYDRTIAGLRARGPVHAFGFAYSRQRVDAVPHEPTDAPLDGVITEMGLLRPGEAAS
jgi:5-formyltetrahydrofolate cyclo-ligase